jgi:hypothetical protein
MDLTTLQWLVNAGIATEGLWHDLNHHVPAYQNMARLTLADWTCTINHCVCPLDRKGLLRDFTVQYWKISAAWIIAHKILTTLKLKMSLRATDSSHILRSEVSLSHVLNIAKAHEKIVPDGRAVKTLVSCGIVLLVDIGLWQMANGVAWCFKFKAHAPSGVNWTVKVWDNCVRIAGILNELNTKWFAIGDLDLMMTKEVRKSHAETYITMMARIQPFPPSEPHHAGSNWASDGSMIPAAGEIGDPKSVTAALTGPSTLVL